MGDLEIDQINVVVSDVPALAGFLRDVGVEVADSLPEWMGHHRTIGSDGNGLHVDVDSSAFAAQWGGVPSDWHGVVLVLRVRRRGDVDEVYRRAVEAGAAPRRAPYDAFWGARAGFFQAPGGVVFGVMSPVDEQARSAPPDPVTFGNVE